MEKRLGRGLGSLLPSKSEPEAGPSMIPVDAIRPNRFQPRKHFDESALAELRDSIRTHGVLQPIAVRQDGSQYELIAGERRWRAAKEAGLARIPAVVRASATDAAMLELALVENVQRADLDPIERALGYQRMVVELGLTQQGVAERVGLKRSTVANHIRLLELSEPIQRLVARSTLTMGHARALLGVADPQERSRLADLVVQLGLSVRQVEERVRVLNGAAPVEALVAEEQEVPANPGWTSPREDVGEAPAEPWVRAIEDRLRRALGVKVAVKNQPGTRGQVVITYSDREELERVLGVIAPADRL
jgi:ParB family chromosome partitioning protein